MNMSAASVTHVADLLNRFDVHTLLAGAAHLRPDHMGLGDVSGGLAPISFQDFDRRAHGLAGAMRDMGLRPRDRVLLNIGASPDAVIALAATLRAGCDAVMAPLYLNTGDLGSAARQSGAVALIGEARAGEEAAIENLFSVAALASEVRMVCSVGAVEIDGAAPLDPQALANGAQDMAPSQSAMIFTFAADGALVEHRQSTLVAAALDIAARARLTADAPLLTTFAPTSFAGLATGPFASLLTGASLMLLRDVRAGSLTDAITSLQPVQAIMPAPLVDALDVSGLLDRDRMRALMSILRVDALAGAQAKAPRILAHPRHAPVTDVYAFGECAAVAELRGADGQPVAPAAQPHMISLDQHSGLALRRDMTEAHLEGHAVTRQEVTR